MGRAIAQEIKCRSIFEKTLFSLTPVPVRFVVGKVAEEQGFFRILRQFPAIITPSLLRAR